MTDEKMKNGHCSSELASHIPSSWRRTRTTRLSTHSHPFAVQLSDPRFTSMTNLKYIPLVKSGILFQLLFSQLTMTYTPLKAVCQRLSVHESLDLHWSLTGFSPTPIFVSLLATSFAALSRSYGPPPTPNGSNGARHPKNGFANGQFGSVNGFRGASNGNGQFNGQGQQTTDFGGHIQSFDGSSVNGAQQGSFGVPLPSDHGFNGGSVTADAHLDITRVGIEQHGFVDTQEQISSGFGGPTGDVSCNEGEVLNAEGLCVEAEVSKTIFLYSAPQREVKRRSETAPTPKPKLNYNIVFVKAPEDSEEDKPIVIPPPQQKTIVYVLNKDGEGKDQEIIEVPAGPAHKPEVYYIRHNVGENPDLSLGLNLETALASAVNEQGKIIEVEVSEDDSTGQFEFKADTGFDGQIDLRGEGTDGLNGQSGFHSGEASKSNEQLGFNEGSAGFNEQSEHQNGESVGYEGGSGPQSGNVFEVKTDGATGNGNGFQTQTGNAVFVNGASFHSGAQFEVRTSSESDSGEISLDDGSHLLVKDHHSQSVLPQQPSLQRQQPSGLYNTPRTY